jgi:hypothetical protein
MANEELLKVGAEIWADCRPGDRCPDLGVVVLVCSLPDDSRRERQPGKFSVVSTMPMDIAEDVVRAAFARRPIAPDDSARWH